MEKPTARSMSFQDDDYDRDGGYVGLHFGQISLNHAPKMNAIDEVDSEKKQMKQLS